MALIYQPSKRIFCGWFEPLKSTTYSEYPIFFAYRFSSGMVFLICSAIHFEPPSSLRHSLRSMRSARNTSPTRPTGRSEVRGERLKPGSTSARLKARKKPRGDDPRGFLVDKIGAKIGAKPKLPSGSLLPQRILAEKGSVEPR